MLRALVPLLLIAGAARLMAVEFVDDARLELGGFGTAGVRDHRDVTAGSDSAYLTSGTTNSSSNGSYDASSFALNFVWGDLHRGGGLLMSAGMAVFDSSSDVSDPGIGQTFSLESTISEARFGIGYGLPLNHWSFFEFMADFGIGYMRSDGIDRSQAFGWEEIESATGVEASIGGHIAWSVCLVRGLVLGVQASAGWHVANLHNDFATGASYDERLRETIIDGRFIIGYRF